MIQDQSFQYFAALSTIFQEYFLQLCICFAPFIVGMCFPKSVAFLALILYFLENSVDLYIIGLLNSTINHYLHYCSSS